MAELSLTLSCDAIKLAKKKGIDPLELIRRYGIQNSDKQNSDEWRACSKDGKYLQDFLIERSDGSRFSIHEVESECKGLKKLIITFDGETKDDIPNEIMAYLDNIDYKKLQGNQNYLDEFGDNFLAEKRIIEKYKLARASMKDNNFKDICSIAYLGMVAQNEENPEKYSTYVHKDESKRIETIISTLIEKAKKKEEKESEEASGENEYRKRLLKAIKEKLTGMPTYKLEKVAGYLGLNLFLKRNKPGNNTPNISGNNTPFNGR